MPTVSTVIPCHNAATTVGATLDSLIQQTFGDWEAVAVDDGSTDQTAAILTRYQDQDARVRVIQQHNAGLGGARNAALPRCRGQFVHFLDADDLIEPGFFQTLLSTLRQHRDAGAAFCGWRYVGAGLRDVSWAAAPAKSVITFAELAADNPIPIHTVLLRAGWIGRIGRFDTTLPVAQDWDFWSRGARCGLVLVGTTEPLAVYRMRPDSLSRDAESCMRAAARIVATNHRHDPRCTDPLPEWRDGAPGEQESVALADATFNASVAAGGAQQPERITEILEEVCGKQARFDPLSCALRLHSGVPFHRCCSPKGWPQLWPLVRPEIEKLTECMEERFGMPGFARKTLHELEKLLRGREFVLQRIVDHINGHPSSFRELILYGMGRNGRYLHEHLAPVARAAGLRVRVADDNLSVEQLAKEGFDPVGSDQLAAGLDRALVVVTPLRADSISQRLKGFGWRDGRNQLSWSSLAETANSVEV